MSIIENSSQGDSVADGSSDETVASGESVSEIISANSNAESETLSRDLVFDVLKNRRRRHALHYLKQQDGSVELSELAEQVAAWENDSTVEGISAAERKRVYTALYQSHLPKLDDAGIVEYNQSRGIVELSEKAEELDVYLELVSRDDIPWSKYYLGLALLGVAVVSAAWLQLSPFAVVPDIFWAAIIVTAFSVSAVVHTYVTQKRRVGSGGTPPEVEDE
jgi:DNA-binding transcriptional ArsR family regulator